MKLNRKKLFIIGGSALLAVLIVVSTIVLLCNRPEGKEQDPDNVTEP